MTERKFLLLFGIKQSMADNKILKILQMKKYDKQRLFEVLAKIDKSFKPNLGPKIYVKPSDVPSQIVEWAKSIIGSGFQNNITIQKSNGSIEIGMPWHDADRETHQYFKLTDNGAVKAGNPVSKSGWSEVNMFDKYGNTPIPSGYVLATVGTYPKRLRVVTSPDAMNIIPDNKDTLDKLSDDAMVALNNAVSLKPAYRQKFDNNVYQELISLGLLNSQKAITIDGRNIIKSPEAIERLKKIQDKDREENGWSGKYKITL
jgi:hypothetical protein